MPSDLDSSSGMDTEIETIQLSTVSSSYLMGQGPNIANMFITSNTLTTKIPNQDLPDNNLTCPVMPVSMHPVRRQDAQFNNVSSCYEIEIS